MSIDTVSQISFFLSLLGSLLATLCMMAVAYRFRLPGGWLFVVGMIGVILQKVMNTMNMTGIMRHGDFVVLMTVLGPVHGAVFAAASAKLLLGVRAWSVHSGVEWFQAACNRKAA